MTDLKAIDEANDLIVKHEFPWCRARLLHALGAAEEQGVLEDVLEELREAAADLPPRTFVGGLRAALRAMGWAKAPGLPTGGEES